MVEQLGLAIIPRFVYILMASSFTSGTTSGISGAILKAPVLSITTQPALAAMGAKRSLTLPPAEKKPIWQLVNESSLRTCTVRLLPLYISAFPRERSEASSFSSLTGKALSSKIFIISLPTAPVAPTTATFHFFILHFLVWYYQSSIFL